MSSTHERWPSLRYEDWKDTYETLHRWTQIVGKIRLKQLPWINHSWHVTLYPTACGLTTLAMPHGTGTFQIDFDFIRHVLRIQSSNQKTAELPLRSQTVADFYGELMSVLASLDLAVKIDKKPNELEDATPFDQDVSHRSYDPEYANRFWRIVNASTHVLQDFRARFIGKSSPVHFFWGSFDLAVTRFSGRPAPMHPGKVSNLPDWVAQEAYSHEVASVGFWPGGGPTPFPLFYAYAYPEPPQFSAATLRPSVAAYHTGLHEFVLPYEDVRKAGSPGTALFEFAQSAYEAAATLANWDRSALERKGEVSSRTAKMLTTH